MKKGVHPDNYRSVVFQDLNDNTTFLTRSTVATEETITLDGTEYPLVKIHISSSSHPFYTGQEKLVDIEGRVDKFKARREAAQKAQSARTTKTQKPAKQAKESAQKLGATTAPVNSPQSEASEQ
jgi:large subunit ribosomal protein L31